MVFSPRVIAVVVSAAVAIGVGGAVVNGGGGRTPYSTPTPTAGSSFPNTSGANVFISDQASTADNGVNCKRFSTAQSTPPTASTVCGTFPGAYNVAQLGDTVWVLDGTYNGARQRFSSSNPVTGKSLASNDCRATNQCVYYIPQPSHESTVHLYENYAGGFDISDDADHTYFKNFGTGACPSVGDGGDDVIDITFDSVVGIQGGDLAAGCDPAITGRQQYVRILNSEFSYLCTSAASGGSGITGGIAIQSAIGDGDTTFTNLPDHILIDKNYIHDWDPGVCTGGHQDCIHVYNMSNSTISRNRFDNCYDSSILAEGFDGAGAENNVIENNFFGPTQCCGNNCCLRGAGAGDCASEPFDDWIIRFNTSVSTINNKTCNVLVNVSFIGNVSLGTNTCATGTNVVWAYNVENSSACNGTDSGGQTNSTVKLTTITTPIDLHHGASSVVDAFVPSSQAQGCSSIGVDYDGDLRPSTCDAGADEG